MKLQNLNVAELTAKESKEVDGGFILEYNIIVVGGLFALGFYNGYHSQK